MIGAIQQIVTAVFLTARDRYRRRRRIVMRGQKPSGSARWDAGASRQQNQIGGLAPVQWKIDNALLVDNFGNRGVLCLYHGRIRGDLHVLSHRANIQPDVDLDIVTDLKNNAGLYVRTERRSAGFQAIW